MTFAPVGTATGIPPMLLADQIAHKDSVLEAGHVVLTGTPRGVPLSGRFPYLTAGHAVRIEIDGLGGQTPRMTGAQE